jgi:hypothetical protein
MNKKTEAVMKELDIEPVLDYIVFREWVKLGFPKPPFTISQTEKGLWVVQWKDGVKILLWDSNRLYGL